MLIRCPCILCGGAADDTAAHPLCRDCYLDLPLHPAGACPCRAVPAPAAALCERCFGRAAAFDSCIAGCLYGYPVTRMIKKLKYQARLDLARALSGPLVEKIRREGAVQPERLVPIPLHRARLRRRGFNQAGEIARVLSRRLSLPVDEQLVRRHRPTAQQYELRPEQRINNVRGAFSLTKTMEHKSIALVDDVLTTGATANELARLLKRHGAEHVQLWCLARALPAPVSSPA